MAEDNFQEEADTFEDINALLSRFSPEQRGQVYNLLAGVEQRFKFMESEERRSALLDWLTDEVEDADLSFLDASDEDGPANEPQGAGPLLVPDRPASMLRLAARSTDDYAMFLNGLKFEDTPMNRVCIAALIQVAAHELDWALEQDGECETNAHLVDFVPA